MPNIKDLGAPIQKFIKEIQSKVTLTDSDLELFEYIKVRDLAKIYDEMEVNDSKQQEVVWQNLRTALYERKTKSEILKCDREEGKGRGEIEEQWESPWEEWEALFASERRQAEASQREREEVEEAAKEAAEKEKLLEAEREKERQAEMEMEAQRNALAEVRDAEAKERGGVQQEEGEECEKMLAERDSLLAEACKEMRVDEGPPEIAVPPVTPPREEMSLTMEADVLEAEETILRDEVEEEAERLEELAGGLLQHSSRALEAIKNDRKREEERLGGERENGAASEGEGEPPERVRTRVRAATVTPTTSDSVTYFSSPSLGPRIQPEIQSSKYKKLYTQAQEAEKALTRAGRDPEHHQALFKKGIALRKQLIAEERKMIRRQISKQG